MMGFIYLSVASKAVHTVSNVDYDMSFLSFNM